MYKLKIFILLISLFFVNTLYSQNSEIKFAWLSDIHIGSSLADEDLMKSVHDINSIKDIEFVVISGDIAESGSTKDLQLTKKILDSLDKKYYIIPGNHDTKWSESGCTAFPSIFGSDKFSFIFKGYKFIGMHQGPVMKMGDGHFSPEDLRWLDSELQKIDNEPLIFITHYPLDSSITNWYEAIERLKKKNIKSVLVGHGHTNSILDFEGIPGFMSRSNLRDKNKVCGYNIVCLKSDSIFISERNPFPEKNKEWVKQSIKNPINTDKKYPRPDFNGNDNYKNIKIEWTYNSSNLITAKPAIWKGMIFIGNSSGEFYAISSVDGKKIWSFKTGNAIYSSADIDRNCVVFASTDGTIYCLKATDGSLIWNLKTNSPIVASPKISRAKVFIGGSDGIFRCIDLFTGLLLWEFKGMNGFVETIPLIYNDKVFFGAWDSYFYALKIENGNLCWKWSGDRKGILYSPAACVPVAADGKVFIVAPDRCMTAIYSNSGKNAWRTKNFQVREMIGISEDETRIYAKTMYDSVYAFAAIGDSIKILWGTNCNFGFDIDPSMLIEMEGMVFFGTQKGYVFALNSKNGKIEWKYRLGAALINNVTPISSKEIVITDMDGKIYYLKVN
jgi:outer membrane protein assembly factor BamB/predicted phosphodiesterase